MTILKWIVMLAGGGYFAFVAFLYLAQRQFVFIHSRHILRRPLPAYRRPKKPSSTSLTGRV